MLIIQTDYQIRDLPELSIDQVSKLMSEYYHPDLKIDVMKDYVYDKHTTQGRQLGRGTQHFINEGMKIINLGYPELWKDEFIAVRINKS